MSKYEIIIYWSVEDHAFILSLQKFQNCRAVQPMELHIRRHSVMLKLLSKNG